MKIELPDGGWALFYEPAKVPDRKRKPVRSAFYAFLSRRDEIVAVDDDDPDGRNKLSPELLAFTDALSDAVTLAMIQEWSFDLPVDGTSLDDLPGDAKDALELAAAPCLHALLPGFEPSEEAAADPKAGTPNSAS